MRDQQPEAAEDEEEDEHLHGRDVQAAGRCTNHFPTGLRSWYVPEGLVDVIRMPRPWRERRRDMSLKSLLKALGKALPVVLANAPAVIGAVKDVAKAVKKAPAKPAA